MFGYPPHEKRTPSFPSFHRGNQLIVLPPIPAKSWSQSILLFSVHERWLRSGHGCLVSCWNKCETNQTQRAGKQQMIRALLFSHLRSNVSNKSAKTATTGLSLLWWYARKASIAARSYQTIHVWKEDDPKN
ncbi:hypothetical protein GmHk_05G013119 [Glycine max]|nr:hypothetical protein GmHk_05G013119 [Glycine max]